MCVCCRKKVFKFTFLKIITMNICWRPSECECKEKSKSNVSHWNWKFESTKEIIGKDHKIKIYKKNYTWAEIFAVFTATSGHCIGFAIGFQLICGSCKALKMTLQLGFYFNESVRGNWIINALKSTAELMTAVHPLTWLNFSCVMMRKAWF